MGKKTRNYILELKNQALQDKATELKINNKNIDEYEETEFIKRETICVFKCICGEICNNKSIVSIFAKNGSGLVCKKCSKKNSDEKQSNTKKNQTQEQKNKSNQKRIETNKAKYGVSHVTQLEEVKQKRNTTIEKLNEEDPDRPNRIIETQKNTIKELNEKDPNRQNVINQTRENTCQDKYGVSNVMKSKEVKEKTKNTIKELNEKYPNRQSNINQQRNETNSILNEKYPNRQNEINETRQNTCQDKYGTKFVSQVDEFKEKQKNTMMDRYGVEHIFQHPEYRDKFTKTMLDKYGKKHALQIDKFKEKFTQTSLQNYGVRHPSQNEEVFNKIINALYRNKEYTLPSGKIILVQGDEAYTLDELFKQGYKEEDILTQYIVDYEYNNEKHRYFADCYIKSINKIIETKSTYTIKLNYELNMIKWKSCIEQGYDFEFWIYDDKKNKTILKL